MAVIFKKGDTPTRWDLRIYIRDDKDRFFDPYLITYAFYSKNKIRFGAEGRIPIKEDTGYYFVGETFNPNFFPGEYYVEWSIQRDSTSPLEIARQEFAITK